MRAGPLGLLFSDVSEVSRAAREQSRITHLDPRCAAGSVAIARAVSIAARAPPVAAADFLQDIAESIVQDDASFADAISRISDWLSLEPAAAARQLHQSGLDPGHGEWQGISAFVIPSVVWSLYAFLRSPDDYWETVCTAIAVGGDTDSMAAMAGAISSARLGPAALPETLLSRINDRNEWGADALSVLARACALLADDNEVRR
jgi:ADP-ribosylglycohydrolase